MSYKNKKPVKKRIIRIPFFHWPLWALLYLFRDLKGQIKKEA
jgi:hypothetical protein